MFLGRIRFFNQPFKNRLGASFSATAANQSILSPLLDAAVKDAELTSNKTLGASKLPLQEKLIFTTGEMRVSQKKLNHLARLIKGMDLEQAQSQMRNVLKKRGKDVAAMLHRAGCALSHNWGQNKQDYIISQAWIGKGVFLKRIRIHGRGRSGKMTRPYAHLKVMLEKKKSFSSILPSIDPVTGLEMSAEKRAQKEVEFFKLVKIFKRDRLFVTMKDTQPIYGVNPPWTSKGWKYITSSKWISPNNAMKK
jgi:ribosomal protein L22